MFGRRQSGSTVLRHIDMGNFRSTLELLQNEGVQMKVGITGKARLILPPGWRDISICGPERAVFDPSGRKRIVYHRRDAELKDPWVSCAWA